MNLELPTEIKIVESEEFRIFSKDIDYLTGFFIDLSELIYSNGHIISFITHKGHFSFNTVLIDSAAQTLKSIKLCCSIGSFSDANTLTRKLRDDLIQYVYILNIINLRKPFLEESLIDFKMDDAEEFVNSILNLQFNHTFTNDEKAVIAWFNDAVPELPGSIKKKLDFENYMKILRQNPKIQHILTEYRLAEYWEVLRKRLNDYVHNNSTLFSSYNHISARDKNLTKHLKNINIRTSYISSFFLVLLLMIKSSLISSTDYIDHLENDMEPPEGSQYFVANFVQDFINKKVSKIHPQLKGYLKDNNIHGMKID